MQKENKHLKLKSQIAIFQAVEGSQKIKVRIEDENS